MRERTKGIVPTLLLPALRQLGHLGRGWDWQTAPDAWRRRNGKGWDVGSVAVSEQGRWQEYVEQLTGASPLGVEVADRRTSAADSWRHNLYVSHALVFALAGAQRHNLSVLDWGGGLGHLSVLASTTLPDVEVDYHVKELAALCASGRGLLPDVTFHEDERCLERRYDLVVASGSLQYAEDWRAVLTRLAAAASGHLWLARVPVVFSSDSFTIVQRAYGYGYGTEYTGWVLNRTTVLEAAAAAGLTPVREFLLGETPYVHGAPEQFEGRGFLFRAAP